MIARHWPSLAVALFVTLTLGELSRPQLRQPSSVYAATGLSENFDGVAVPNLPSGWTQGGSGASSQWQTINTFRDSIPNSAYAPATHNPSVRQLFSPTFTMGTSTKLTFRHSFPLEFGRDGGVLEISINAGPFVDVVAAGGSFDPGSGYNATPLAINTGNPLGGRQAWTGGSNSFGTESVNLPASPGQSVQLRWILGSDQDVQTTVGAWYIDSINLPSTAPTATPTLTPCPGGYQFTVYTALAGQVVPPNDSPAEGTGSLLLDPSTGMLSYNLSYSNLSSDGATGAEKNSHLHNAAYGQTGLVFEELPKGPSKVGTAVWDSTKIQELMAMRVYWDVHTDNYSAGALRGQVFPVTECAPITSTPTRTTGPTASATASHTRTSTPTASFTPTRTFTLTPSQTPTPSATATRTATPTPSATTTPSVTRTSTSVATPTRSATPTLSPSRTLTSTGTPSLTPTAPVSATTTPTSNGLTTSALKGRVQFQGRDQAPQSSRVQQLEVTFWKAGVVVRTATPQTAANGSFEISDLEPDTYDVRVKHRQGLSQQRNGVAFGVGTPVELDFGTLRTGNSNGDEIIDIADFSLLRAAFGTPQSCGTAIPNPLPCADYDGSGQVDIVDFSLQRSNFGRSGPILLP